MMMRLKVNDYYCGKVQRQSIGSSRRRRGKFIVFYLSENLVNKRNIVDVSLTVHRSVYQSINFRVIRERAKRENTDGVTFTP